MPDITVVALLRITSPCGEETALGFDAAWHRSLELPTPVNVKFVGFVRKP